MTISMANKIKVSRCYLKFTMTVLLIHCKCFIFIFYNGYGLAFYLMVVLKYVFGILAKCKEINASHIMGMLGVAKAILETQNFDLPHLIELRCHDNKETRVVEVFAPQICPNKRVIL